MPMRNLVKAQVGVSGVQSKIWAGIYLSNWCIKQIYDQFVSQHKAANFCARSAIMNRQLCKTTPEYRCLFTTPQINVFRCAIKVNRFACRV